MSTFLHGVGTVQFIDKSAELIDIRNFDISSLSKTGIINFEHQNTLPNQIVGKILKAKRIMSESDCSDEHELYFWKKVKAPYIYIMAELLDDYCDSAKHVAGILRYDRDRKDQNEYAIMWFSVEGSEIPNTRKGHLITRGIGRKVTLTSAPCNQGCAAELLENQKPQVKDEFEEIFKSESEAIELFKSGEGSKIYESFLAKKEDLCDIHKAAPSYSMEGETRVFSKLPKNYVGSVHTVNWSHPKTKSSNKYHFATAQEAHNHVKELSSRGMKDVKITSSDSNLNKALEAGSTNAAPSTLTSGAAYQTENLARPKKDWKKRSKEEYDRWPHKEKFESFMKARMPHLHEGEIRAIGRALSLKKSIEAEKSLESLVKSGEIKSPEATSEHHALSDGTKVHNTASHPSNSPLTWKQHGEAAEHHTTQAFNHSNEAKKLKPYTPQERNHVKLSDFHFAQAKHHKELSESKFYKEKAEQDRAKLTPEDHKRIATNAKRAATKAANRAKK